jgi:hypothetical protein
MTVCPKPENSGTQLPAFRLAGMALLRCAHTLMRWQCAA